MNSGDALPKKTKKMRHPFDGFLNIIKSVYDATGGKGVMVYDRGFELVLATDAAALALALSGRYARELNS